MQANNVCTWPVLTLSITAKRPIFFCWAFVRSAPSQGRDSFPNFNGQPSKVCLANKKWKASHSSSETNLDVTRMSIIVTFKWALPFNHGMDCSALQFCSKRFRSAPSFGTKKEVHPHCICNTITSIHLFPLPVRTNFKRSTPFTRKLRETQLTTSWRMKGGSIF